MTNGQDGSGRYTSGKDAGRLRRYVPLVTLILLLVAACVLLVIACSPDEEVSGDGVTTTSSEDGATQSGDIEGGIDEEIKVGAAIVTVRALQATFQPAVPAQRLSEQTPTAPGSGETFYQAYVRIKNTGVTPLRVDPEDFVCAVGDTVVTIEPTRSGPFPRSLLKNASLDLLLTFRAQAGFAVLIYSPPWYDGSITIAPQSEETTTTT
jgi:hypothetical protein